MVRLEMLPAAHGDALLVEWGQGRDIHRLLVDGGPLGTYRTLRDRVAAINRSPSLELLVVTHVDGDHIEGVVRLLQDRTALRLRLGDVWFNGWPQLAAEAKDRLGPDQGEMVGAMLSRDRQPWNQAFAAQPVQVPPDGALPTFPLPGDAQVTVLGPGPRQLARLRREWTKVLREIKVTPGKVDAALERLARRKDLAGLGDVLGEPAGLDNSVANSTSISLLFEYQERKLLLTGDSHGDVLADGLRRLLVARGGQRLTVDAFKLPHHGSRGNVTNEVLGLVDTTRYLVSTSGARYHHPDREAMQRILGRPERRGPIQVYFNYDSKTTRPWGTPERQRRYQYEAVFPTAPDVGVAVEV